MADDRIDGPPAWVVEALRAPVASRAASRAAIMARVRRASRPSARALSLRPVAGTWRRRGVLAPAGVLLAASLFAMATVGSRLDRGRSQGLLSPLVVVLGDSVVAASGTTLGAVLRDTLALVEVVVRGDAIRTAQLLGRFNGWRREATPLAPLGDGSWRTRTLVPRDALALAVLVNDATLLPATVAPPPRAGMLGDSL